MSDQRTARLGIVMFVLLCVFGPLPAWAAPEEPISGFDFFRRSLEVRGLQLEISDHLQNHRIDEAVEALEKSLSLMDASFWPMRPLIDDNLSTLANLLVLQTRYSQAVEAARSRLELLRGWSSSDLKIASALLELGRLLKMVDDSAALGHLKEARALRAARLGDDHPDTAEVDQALGVWFFERGDLTLAREHIEQARSVLERRYQPKDPRLSTLLVNLAALERASGEYQEARALLERALEIESVSDGKPSLGSAQVRSALGLLFFEMSLWEEALPMLEQALKSSHPWLGEDHPELLVIHLNSAMVLAELGELESSEQHARKASEISQAHLGDRHRLTLECRYVLGTLLMMKGELTEAEKLLSAVLADRKAILDRGHIDTISTRVSLGQVLEILGRDAEALDQIEQALSELGQLTSPLDRFSAKLIVTALEILARRALADGSSQEEGDWAEIDALAKRLAGIFESTTGADGLEMAELHHAMALAASALGQPIESLKRREQARVILEQTRFRSHPQYAKWLANEASFHRLAGDLKSASVSMEKALEVFTRIYGESGLHTVQPRVDLAAIYERQGRIEPALELLEEAMAIEERSMLPILVAGSERDQRRYLRTLEDTLLLAISLHQRSAVASPRALDVALKALFQRKSLDFDAAQLRAQLAQAAESPSLKQAIGKLEKARSRWSRYVAENSRDEESEGESPSWSEVENLERNVADLLSAQLADPGVRLQDGNVNPLAPVTIEQVRAALPEDSVLVEWVSIEPPDIVLFRNEPKRYLAYVVPSRGRPSFVNLGPAEPIDVAVDAFLEAIEKRDTRVRQRASELYNLTVGRLESDLKGFDRWIFSPVGELHQVPFAALVDGERRYLVERYEIGYLSSGRDLVKLSEPAPPPKDGAWILAGPAFGQGNADVDKSQAVSDKKEGGIESLPLSNLPGFHAEARLLGRLLEVPAERPLSGSQATEAALRSVAGPSFLHVATHGFLLPDSQLGGGGLLSRSMARSGLALAGIRDPKRLDSRDDGFVSALELSSIDLRGTQVATLSACQTGQGEPMGSHGLFGLRRALALAGARTQVTSLWLVDDRAAVELMTSWYAQILRGVPRGTALREAQLAMLNDSSLPNGVGENRSATPTRNESDDERSSRGRAHPYYWAVFTVAGDLGSLPKSMRRP